MHILPGVCENHTTVKMQLPHSKGTKTLGNIIVKIKTTILSSRFRRYDTFTEMFHTRSRVTSSCPLPYLKLWWACCLWLFRGCTSLPEAWWFDYSSLSTLTKKYVHARLTTYNTKWAHRINAAAVVELSHCLPVEIPATKAYNSKHFEHISPWNTELQCKKIC